MYRAYESELYRFDQLYRHFCEAADTAEGQGWNIVKPLRTVKKILSENYVRPDEAEKVKSTVRERGSLKLIDKVTVTLNEKRDVYEALLANLGVNRVEVPSAIVKKFEKLLVGGIWCIITLEYFFEEDQKGAPFLLRDLKPIQLPNMDLEELFQGRRASCFRRNSRRHTSLGLLQNPHEQSFRVTALLHPALHKHTAGLHCRRTLTTAGLLEGR